MLISQLHLPHVITNSMRPLHALSHSIITFRKAQSRYQHVSLKLVCLGTIVEMSEGSFEDPSAAVRILATVTPKKAAVEAEAPRTEWA